MTGPHGGRRRCDAQIKLRRDGPRAAVGVPLRRKHIHAQLIDDAKGVTVAAASTLEKDDARRRRRPAPTSKPPRRSAS